MPEKIINLFGVSGGKDSDAVLLWGIHKSGYDPDTIRATFCDTGNESEYTYAHIEMLRRRVHPIETLHPDLGFYDLARKKGRFPSARARFCTQHLKMIPTQRWISARQAEGYTVVSHSGVRAGESEDRKHLTEYDTPEESFFGCVVRRPLLRWSLADVWAIHEEYFIPGNPLYAMGAMRVGCLPCVMSRKKEIEVIARVMPERIDMIREQETSFTNKDRGNISTFFARNMVPIRFRTKIIQAPVRKPKRTKAERTQARWNALHSTEAQTTLELLYDDDYGKLGQAMQDGTAAKKLVQDVAVCTIDDVVRWALSGMDDSDRLDLADIEDLETGISCSSGMCE